MTSSEGIAKYGHSEVRESRQHYETARSWASSRRLGELSSGPNLFLVMHGIANRPGASGAPETPYKIRASQTDDRLRLRSPLLSLRSKARINFSEFFPQCIEARDVPVCVSHLARISSPRLQRRYGALHTYSRAPGLSVIARISGVHVLPRHR